MRILLTGASGFLGTIIQEKLRTDHEIISLGRGSSNSIVCDLKISAPDLNQIDVIVHAAGKAHVIPKTDAEKREFFQVNAVGTINLLSALKELPKLFVFISTVAVYGREEGVDIEESHFLQGDTPYARSKIQAEKLIEDWGKANHVDVVILRLPLIVGPNPPGNLGAIIQAMKKGFYFRLGKGEARKSMVLASDVATLIPALLGKSGTFNLTDGLHPSLAQLDQKIATQLGKRVNSFPLFILSGLAKIGDLVSFFPLNSYRLSKLTQTLTFSDQKAREELSWTPKSVLENLFNN